MSRYHEVLGGGGVCTIQRRPSKLKQPGLLGVVIGSDHYRLLELPPRLSYREPIRYSAHDAGAARRVFFLGCMHR
jgi:hypothetical protein